MTLKTSPDPALGLLCTLGAEEAVILLEPKQMFRMAADLADWRAEVRCFVPDGALPGLFLSLPHRAIRPLLAAAAGHPVEAELQQLLFDVAELSHWPDFTYRFPFSS